MSASNDFEADLLALVFLNTNIANLGDATGVRGSTVAGSVYVALHTADPGEGGKQNTNEVTYTGYARVAVARGGATWSVTGTAPTQVANVAEVAFGACTVGNVTATHFSVGYESAGATKIIVSGALDAPLAISAGITPRFAAGALKGTVD